MPLFIFFKKDLIGFRPYYFKKSVSNSLPKHTWVIFEKKNDIISRCLSNRISFSTTWNKLYIWCKDGLCLSLDFSHYVMRLVSMRNRNDNGHKNTTQFVPSVESIRHFGTFSTLVKDINSLPRD